MKLPQIPVQKQDKYLKIFAYCIIAFGIIIRIIVYLQNRDLFIDEANLARNIYERGYMELLRPLNYEQYAPPIFLWILKSTTLLFGYSEYAYRIYPLLAGLFTMIVMYIILREQTSMRALWYPLVLFAGAYMFIWFSSELKQHGCDVLITLLLVLLTTRINILKVASTRFIIYWSLIGTVAIWASMPCVFLLAGIGGYYFYTCISHKAYKKMTPLFIAGGTWATQFLFYYFAILKQQANSEYIQRVLGEYYVVLVPHTKDDWMHNWYLVKNVIMMCGGFTFLGWTFNLMLIVVAVIHLLRKNIALAILLVLPIILAYIASGLRQYAFVERYVLFLTPLFFLLFGFGMWQLMGLKFAWLRVLVVIVALICAKNNNMIEMAYRPYKFEELRAGLTFMKEHNISGEQLYVDHGARPAFIYYTQIHPGKALWKQFEGAHLLWWDISYDSIAQNINGNRVGFIFTAMTADGVINDRKTIEKHLKLESFTENVWDRRFAYIYTKP